MVSDAELGPRTVDVTVADGAVVTQRMVPVRRVGLYIPGGLAPLASGVIMNVVPGFPRSLFRERSTKAPPSSQSPGRDQSLEGGRPP